MFPEAEPRETLRFEGNEINCFPRDQSLTDLLYSTMKNELRRRENKISVLMTLKNALQTVKLYHHATFNHALITCSNGRRSTFAGNSALLPSDVIDFAMLPAQRLLAGNSFIVRCHVTSK